mmetsp:Transcript_31666/g.95157  ORF Transcript_31666/g.95157 Transcript_31666/m.95157 type:complete len:153 (+) Transcript_31666:323-781(+)
MPAEAHTVVQDPPEGMDVKTAAQLHTDAAHPSSHTWLIGELKDAAQAGGRGGDGGDGATGPELPSQTQTSSLSPVAPHDSEAAFVLKLAHRFTTPASLWRPTHAFPMLSHTSMQESPDGIGLKTAAHVQVLPEHCSLQICSIGGVDGPTAQA